MTGAALRLAFAGTPDIAATILSRLLANTNHSIEFVLTQPDRGAGRGRKTTASAVKQVAMLTGIPVQQPATKQELEAVAELANVDALIVVAYGMILPETILTLPRCGCINVHTSLLPRWRGAAPIQRAIQSGDKETGVSIMQMDAGLDTGPIILQSRCKIDPDETAASLHDKLAILGADSLITALEQVSSGALTLTTQDDSGITYADKISKQEAELDWTHPADTLERQVRAFNPAPVAYATLNNQTLRIWQATANMSVQHAARPGDILAVTDSTFEVACETGSLIVNECQLPGKKRMPVKQLLPGRPAFLQT